MSPRIRIIILIVASIILLIVLSHSGELLPVSDMPSELPDQFPTGSGNASPLFSLTVTPMQAHAHPGDPVDCAVLITPYNGFDDPVELELKVDAGPVFKGTYHAGTMTPPYPKTYEYRVNVPEQSPAPVTVNGTLMARGGGFSDKVDLVLFIES
ncbi:MAG TPA: hypothetical protein PK154_02820 [Methanoregulaceae archaeon]|mgnify:CR=1 FL=1|jgi:hypothetical protein|nr:hypothetical protein [Methanoregulaceae archaeon]HOB58606.1 hypothetical protein [Methanoregulaceae archaeon]HPW10026.1 hypothetical protein [Methanoregulaceae archaeon]